MIDTGGDCPNCGKCEGYGCSCTTAEQDAAHIEQLLARIEQLEAAIKRQAGAAQTLRNLTLNEVRNLQDKDRSEYNAAKTLDSEREANEILTDRVEQLEAALATARNDALREAEGAVSSLRMQHVDVVWQWNEAIDKASDDITALITEEQP